MSPCGFISSCSAFSSDKRKEQVTILRVETLDRNTGTQPAVFLTHILKGVPSVRSHVDEEDTLSIIITEVHSGTSIQSPCMILVNGAVRGVTLLRV